MRTTVLAVLAIAIGASGCKRADGDGSPAETAGPMVLTRGASATVTIGSAGGVVTVGDFTLEVPPGALAADEDLTVTQLEGTAEAWLLEPSGLVFAEPAIATFPHDSDGAEAQIPIYALTTEGDAAALWGAPVDLAGTARVPIPHFSMLFLAFEVPPPGLHVDAWLPGGPVDPLTAPPATPRTGSHASGEPFVMKLQVGVDGPLAGKARFRLWSPDLPREVYASGATSVSLDFVADEVMVQDFDATRSGPVRLVAASSLDDVDTVAPQEVVGREATFACEESGEGRSAIQAMVSLSPARFGAPGRDAFFQVSSVSFVIDGNPVEVELETDLVLAPALVYAPTCRTDRALLIQALQADVLTAGFETALGQDGLVAYVEAEQLLGCVWNSPETDCREPRENERLQVGVDPLLRLDPTSANRLLNETFPCGATGDKLVICAAGANATAQDYVYLATVTGDPIDTADPTGLYQYGFVFDADGDTANNYQGSPAYPGDFWIGSDTWYELTYAPGVGYQVRVRDVRLGYADVTSAARFVVQGRELALLVPRAELGANPSARISAFRHEGDWGLEGGPWSADYLPPLGQMVPVGGTGPIVLTR